MSLNFSFKQTTLKMVRMDVFRRAYMATLLLVCIATIFAHVASSMPAGPPRSHASFDHRVGLSGALNRSHPAYNIVHSGGGGSWNPIKWFGKMIKSCIVCKP
ncbi:uncharacterized protein UTRI_10022 [Ustilago trichophora]|uniref:Uncharacterized protein n=1 Tax=Ustilago trichophora TaxID=86804 RepID=A0A5C3DRR2_9BASI|nr:uncharacterized protein UTRI_10022 [Ustilago trichophora]